MTQVFGQISADGGIVRNSGQIESIDHPETGIYQVSFKPGTFRDEPVVVATASTAKQKCGRSGTTRFISITNATTDQVCFGVVRSNGLASADDRGFNFIAVRD